MLFFKRPIRVLEADVFAFGSVVLLFVRGIRKLVDLVILQVPFVVGKRPWSLFLLLEPSMRLRLLLVLHTRDLIRGGFVGIGIALLLPVVAQAFHVLF